MERFLKKRRTSVQDENVGPSHENNQNDGSVPTQSDRQIDASTHEQIDVPARHHHMDKMMPPHMNLVLLLQEIHLKLKRSIGK